MLRIRGAKAIVIVRFYPCLPLFTRPVINPEPQLASAYILSFALLMACIQSRPTIISRYSVRVNMQIDTSWMLTIVFTYSFLSFYTRNTSKAPSKQRHVNDSCLIPIACAVSNTPRTCQRTYTNLELEA